MSKWIVAAIALFATASVAAALALLERTRRDIVRSNVMQQDLLAETRKTNAPGVWTSANQVHHNCFTDRTTVTCTFTNLSEGPIETCSRGRIAQKEAPGVKLESVIICTGKLGPTETRVVTAPWQGGFADDICYKESAYGKSLDWSKCSFDTEPVDVPLLRRQALASK